MTFDGVCGLKHTSSKQALAKVSFFSSPDLPWRWQIPRETAAGRLPPMASLASYKIYGLGLGVWGS